MDLIVGIDPGISGAVVALSTDKKFVKYLVFKKCLSSEIVSWLASHKSEIRAVLIEKVHAFPRQGVTGVFTFGQNYGWWLGVLSGLGLSYKRVYPLKWQTMMNCRTGGDKNITKERAQKLFPKIKVTHAIADALLIAEHGRRNETGYSEL
jgi:hypothetical protein